MTIAMFIDESTVFMVYLCIDVIVYPLVQDNFLIGQQSCDDLFFIDWYCFALSNTWLVNHTNNKNGGVHCFWICIVVSLEREIGVCL